MSSSNAQRQPGDLILDRYMPHACPEEREAARENLRAFAVAIFKIANRLASEAQQETISRDEQDVVDLMERPTPHP